MEFQSNKGDYQPLLDCLTIQESNIDGLGLFATEDIPKGVCLGISHFIHSRSSEMDLNGTLYDVLNSELIRTPLGGFTNHHEDPNCITRKYGDYAYALWTIKKIEKGEELVVDYCENDCGLEYQNKKCYDSKRVGKGT